MFICPDEELEVWREIDGVLVNSPSDSSVQSIVGGISALLPCSLEGASPSEALLELSTDQIRFQLFQALYWDVSGGMHELPTFLDAFREVAVTFPLEEDEEEEGKDKDEDEDEKRIKKNKEEEDLLQSLAEFGLWPRPIQFRFGEEAEDIAKTVSADRKTLLNIAKTIANLRTFDLSVSASCLLQEVNPQEDARLYPFVMRLSSVATVADCLYLILTEVRDISSLNARLEAIVTRLTYVKGDWFSSPDISQPLPPAAHIFPQASEDRAST